MSEWQHILYHGDCLEGMRDLEKRFKDAIRLIYIDPPFFSGTRYSLKTKSDAGTDKAPTLSEQATYTDYWKGGLDEYLNFMKSRLESMKSMLSENGSLWVHLDWHVSHYVKIRLDELFGYENFINEIVWRRTNSPKSQSRGFGSQHDVILLYAKDESQFSLKPVYRPHDERSLKPYSYEDEKGRFRLIEIEAQGIQRTEGRKQFEWRGRTAPYLYRLETLDQWWDEGLIYRSKNDRYSKKQYLSDVPGLPVSDLWFDIAPIQGSSKEYTGFLTQKPVALLERIIESASEPGDIVADFFAGTGTTAVAAQKLSRRWILSDVSDVAIDLIESRLSDFSDEIQYSVVNL
ncbi:MAG: site-specific DNA-methyltransferase [Candidatus Thorarchaeota archaeon]